MKKMLLILSLLVLMLPAFGYAKDSTTYDQKERIIIGFENGIDNSILDGVPHELHHIYDSINAIAVTVNESALSNLKKQPQIEWIEPDRKVQADGQLIDWGYNATDSPSAREVELSGQGIKVAVIDTGIKSDHPDLQVAGGVSFVEEAATPEDDNGHGTHVAGVISAQNNDIGILGVAPNVSLYAVKALDADGIGNQTDVIAGIEWAIENNIDIINLSITSPYHSPAVQKAVENADEQGVVVVAASGNDETGDGQIVDDIMYPARYPTVIGVGSIDENLVRSSFSYKGESLSYSAPGKEVYSTYIQTADTPDGYALMSGTSMATPYVAGIIALYKESYPELTNMEIRKIIAEKASDLGEKGKDSAYGYGLIQAPYTLFWDLKQGAWYMDNINFLAVDDLITGYPDGTFRPGGFITREEAITMIGRTLGLDGTRRETRYTDVKRDSFGSGYIASAAEAEIVTGYPDNTFKPKASISRGEVAVIIERSFEVTSSGGDSFEDVEEEKFYFEAVNTLYDYGIITGYEDGSFQPDHNISRAEFSTILAKAIDPSLR